MIDVATKKAEFKHLVNTYIHRDGIDKLMTFLEQSDFYDAPCSTRYHLCEKGGLLAHSLNVFEQILILQTVEFPNDSSVDTLESLAIIALFHDLCKVNFYKPCLKRQLVKGVWTDVQTYEIDDQFPFGHGEKSAFLIEKFMSLKPAEALAIRWHMSGYDEAVRGGSYAINAAQQYSTLTVLLQCADQLATFITER